MRKYRIPYLVLYLLSLFILQANGQNLTINSRVTTSDGKPIANAFITNENGKVLAVTDTAGRFVLLEVADTISLYVSADGFQAVMLKPKDALNDIVLEYDLSKQKANVAYRNIFKKDIGTDISVIDLKSVNDIDNNFSITDAINGRTSGLLWYNNIWGMQNAQVFIDGVPRDINSITADEIDHVTLLKGAHAVALYGSIGAKGVILITTKRGEQYKRKIDVRVNNKFGVPRMYPSFLNSADYMTLYNEARINDGLPKLYGDTLINNYRTGNRYQYPDIDYYSRDYLRSMANRTEASARFSGGNQNARFFTNIGYVRSTSLLNIGEGKNENDQAFRARGNVDLNLNDFISSTIDVATIFSNRRSALTNYWQSAATILPFKYAPLIPLSLIRNDSLIEVANSSRNIIDGKYLLGGSQEYLNTPFADLYAGGYNNNVQRVLQVTNKLHFDLSGLAEGLSFTTNIHADYQNAYNQSINNNYAVFSPVWRNDSLVDLIKYGNDYRPGVENINNSYQTRNIGASAQVNYDKQLNDLHSLSLMAVASAIKIQSTGIYQPNKYAHLGVQANYWFKQKYGIDLTGVWVNSTKLPKENKIGFSPSFGFTWQLRNEDFIKNLIFVDYLKAYASLSMLKTDLDITDYFLYENYYSSQGYYAWNDNLNNTNNSATVSLRGTNPDLTFPTRKEFTLGLEGSILKQIAFCGNYFIIRNDGLLTKRLSLYPGFLSDFVPYANYNANQYTGFDLSLTFNKTLSEAAKFSVGFNSTYVTSKVIKRDELYAYNYLNRTGKPVDAIFGLQNAGFFSSTEDIKNSPYQLFGEVRPGDIKYVDQNGDNIIDQNDEVMIGRWISPYVFGLNVTFSYKNITLFVMTTGSMGGYGVKSNDYFWVDGDDKYSTVVLNRWTEQTKNTATFPRLSSLRNENNFRYSDFWLYKTDRLDISRAQLTYTLGKNTFRQGYLKELQIYIGGANLLTLSKSKEILLLNVYDAPQMTYYTLGIKGNF
ncbi:MAG: SusC/RagA family TonB-linked outer membrane protein [Bacteroidales bacterium]